MGLIYMAITYDDGEVGAQKNRLTYYTLHFTTLDIILVVVTSKSVKTHKKSLDRWRGVLLQLCPATSL